MLWDIVEIMKTDLAQLSSEGVDYIQIDAPRYSYYMDPKWREWIRTEMQVEPDAVAGLSNLAMSALDLYAVSPEGMEGATAFAEKRKPDFAKYEIGH